MPRMLRLAIAVAAGIVIAIILIHHVSIRIH